MEKTENKTIDDFTEDKEGKYKKYDMYSSSDIGWLDEVPEHWEEEKLTRTVEGCINGYWGSDPEDGENTTKCIRVADFDYDQLDIDGEDLTKRTIAESKKSGRVLKKGDLLIEKSGGGDKQPVGRVVLFDLDGEQMVSSNFIGRMPVRSGYNPHFLAYLHRTMYIYGVNVKSIKQTTGIQNLDTKQYLNEIAPVPPKHEQDAIVSFLNKKCKDIDELIKKKEELIKLVEEKHLSAIKNVVCEGIHKDVKLKESGVDWLGKVPQHWDAPRIRFVARMESGHTPAKSEEEYWNGNIPWVSLADSHHLRENDYITETSKNISEKGLANSSARILPPETMVFTRDATVGLCAITTREMAVSQHIIGWICEENLIPEYLLNVTKAMDQELDRLTMGATISTVGMEDIKKIKMPLPPIEEQQEIVAHLDEELKKFDDSTEKIQGGIEQLKEYRAALISEAVTGQIDIRGEV